MMDDPCVPCPSCGGLLLVTRHEPSTLAIFVGGFGFFALILRLCFSSHSVSFCNHPLFFLAHTTYCIYYTQIKPDGVQRGIVGNIISRFETKGYKLVAMKTKQATKELLEEHYKDLVKKVCLNGVWRCVMIALRGRIVPREYRSIILDVSSVLLFAHSWICLLLYFAFYIFDSS